MEYWLPKTVIEEKSCGALTPEYSHWGRNPVECWLPNPVIEEKSCGVLTPEPSKVTEKSGYKVIEQVRKGKLQVKGLQADNRKQE